MTKLSVIICTHSPRYDYFSRILEALCKQTLPKSDWEILLIGDLSTEKIKLATDISWHPNARYIDEAEGAIPCARQRGIQEAAGELLVFIEDYSVLDPGYLTEAVNIGSRCPRLGVWGSAAISLEFELEPAKYLKQFSSVLALRNADVPRWSNVFSCTEAMPATSAICVRASVAAAYCQLLKQSVATIAASVNGCFYNNENHEICYCACNIGLGMGIFPQLRQTNLISRDQVAASYLIKRNECQHLLQYLLMYKWQQTVPINLFSSGGFLVAIRELLLCRGFGRQMYLAELRAALKARRMIHELI